MLGLLTAFALLLLPPPAFSKSAADYWQDTDLSFRELRAYVNDWSCYLSDRHFTGCVEALHSLFDSLPGNRLALLSDEELKDRAAESPRLERSFGKLGLYSLGPAPDGGTLTEWRAARKARDRARARALVSTFQVTYYPRIRFAPIVDHAEALLAGDGSPRAKLADAINALLSITVEAHAYIKTQAQLDDALASRKTGPAGAGIKAALVEGKAYVSAVQRGAPAEEAGVRVGDEIVLLDGKPVQGLSAELLGALLPGAEGSRLELELARSGRRLRVSLERRPVAVANLESDIVRHAGRPVGVIRLRSFTERDLCASVGQMIEGLRDSGARALVLDLRGNGGGRLKEALCIAGLFVGRKTVFVSESLKERTREERVPESEEVSTLPLAVLVDGRSASASELVAAALQDHARAWVVGERTYGKGTVQDSGGWILPGILLYGTVERYFRPSGGTTQVTGVQPDFVVPFKPGATDEERFTYREADNYPNALPPVGEPWVQPRPAEAERISSCLRGRGGRAEKAFRRLEKARAFPDYQLLAAEEILRCD